MIMIMIHIHWLSPVLVKWHLCNGRFSLPLQTTLRGLIYVKIVLDPYNFEVEGHKMHFSKPSANTGSISVGETKETDFELLSGDKYSLNRQKEHTRGWQKLLTN